MNNWGTTLRAFLRWWVGELAGLLPAALRNSLRAPSARLILDFATNTARVVQCGGGAQRDLGSYPFDPLSAAPPSGLTGASARSKPTTTVLLPADEVLAPELTLPVEAEDNLREVLGYEMDRQTPFSVEQVYYDYRIEERLKDLKRIRVRAAVAPRELVDRLVDTAVRWGFAPATVGVGDGAEGQCGEPFNLLPESRRAARRSRRGLNRLLGASALLLLAAAVGLPLHRQGMIMQDLQARTDAVRGEAGEVQALRQEIERLNRESTQVVERKLGAPRVIDALNELSRLLPDDTWLQRLELKGTSLTLHGESAAASALIGLLEGSDRFHGATFRSPVVRDPRSGRDRFQIVAEVVTGGDAP